MKITVTQEHIDKGKRGSGKFCPVALAFKDAGLSNVSVGCRTFSACCKRFFWNTPKAIEGYFAESVYLWIREYDFGKDVQPITFEV